MPPALPDPYIVQASLDDFDHFGEITKGWDLETVLLGRGGFRAELTHYVDPAAGFIFTRARYHVRLRQLGAPPPGFLTFCIPASFEFEMTWRRQKVSGFDVAIFPTRGELLADVRSDFDLYLVSYPEEAVMAMAHSIGYRRLRSVLVRQEVLRCRTQDLIALRSSLQTVDRYATDSAGFVRSILGKDILERLVRALANSEPAGGVGRHGELRESAVRNAERYILEEANDDVTIAELCRITGASDRTLQRGFKEMFGVTPKSFISAVRLNKVRRDLVDANPAEINVSDVANRWGFWHMGQFAADYRKMFLELPSETLTKPARRSVLVRA